MAAPRRPYSPLARRYSLLDRKYASDSFSSDAGILRKAMRRLLLVIVFGLLVTAAAFAALSYGSSRESSGRPALRVVDQRPFTVEGRHFRSRERVKVTLYKQEDVRTRRVIASLRGVFRAVLQETPVDRCDMIFVRAVGARGSNAVLKMLPRPACRST
jgi:hypothetical protein